MKKYPKIVQSDKRGQFVIPKEVRLQLGIEEGTAFWVYAIGEEGIFLKKSEPKPLRICEEMEELEEKAEKIKIKKEAIEKAERRYKKEGGWEEI